MILTKSRNSALEQERIICEASEQFLATMPDLPENFPGRQLHLPRLELLSAESGQAVQFCRRTEQRSETGW